MSPVQAEGLEYEFGELRVGLTGLATLGAGWRMEKRDADLLGPTNVPGQQNLCAADDCMSQTGDPAPNQRLVKARGSLSGVNSDNGNLNYDRHDVIAAVTKVTPALNFSWRGLQGTLRGVGFYDPANSGFDESHPNTLYQPAESPRPGSIEQEFASGFKLRDAFVSTVLPLGDNDITLTLGRQVISWGESNFTLFNTLNAINPPDAGIARMPGFQLNEVFIPVPALSFAVGLGGSLALEGFYQYGWEPVVPDPVGSFFSTNDIAGGGRTVLLGFGNYSEDPDRQFRAAGLNGLVSSSSRTARVLDQGFGYPEDGGQYGLQLKYFAENFNGGTEFGFYAMNYHSRLPYLSVFAADASCTRDAIDGSFAAAFVACNGFNPPFNPIGREPLPVDTLKAFLDYPEDIRMFGMSFNTNVGDWALSGEYSFRPNLPLPILQSDVIFAGLSTALPREDIEVPAGVPGIGSPFTIPGHRHAVPDFLSVYRGVEIQPNQRIEGHERQKVGQLVLTGIRTIGGSNPFGADQILVLVEAGASHIPDLPDTDELPFEGSGERTHNSPGADGTGSGGVPDSLRINPTQMTEGFATDFAWGYRIATRFTYNDIYRGINFFPTLVLFHDVDGISSAVIDNYVEGRKMLVGVLDAEFNASFAGSLQYQLFTGAGDGNLRSDRDNLSFNLRYSF